MSKETILKELKKKDLLSQSIMLNWIRSQTNITFKKEERFSSLLKEIVIEEVFKAIDDILNDIEKEVEITEGYNQGKDEAWCDWYECPNCSDKNITKCDKFCPNCGCKLKWL